MREVERERLLEGSKGSDEDAGKGWMEAEGEGEGEEKGAEGGRRGKSHQEGSLLPDVTQRSGADLKKQGEMTRRYALVQ